jgi:methylthioribose-1-phosphate isomerase
VSDRIESASPVQTLKTGHAHAHPEPLSGAKYSAVELMPGDRATLLLDQSLLPRVERYELLTSADSVARAIRTMMVRGAPAIGIGAAYGMVLAAGATSGDAASFLVAMKMAHALLLATRPTAVNLAWALAKMSAAAEAVAESPPPARLAQLAAVARGIHRDDVTSCRTIGALGAANVRDGDTILTHCNAGALATGGFGTALGVIRAAHAAGKKIRVVCAETRPLLQGARLSAWELQRDGLPVTIVTDSAVAQLFAKRAIDRVVVGADRIAANGDVANKIGTYSIACLAQVHGVPFDVAAPWSTVDLACPDGAQIPIEQRDPREVLSIGVPPNDVAIAPDGIRAENPAFDITPARLVGALYTERGVVAPLGVEALRSRA